MLTNVLLCAFQKNTSTLFTIQLSLFYTCLRRLYATWNCHATIENNMMALQICFRAVLDVMVFSYSRKMVTLILMTLSLSYAS